MQSSYSLLFHPKKNKKPEQPPPRPSPSKPRPAPVPVKQEEDIDLFRLPDGPFQEFPLFSSNLNDWKYNVMKFDSRKPVEIKDWIEPIKLNRKDLRREDRNAAAAAAAAPQAVRQMLGPDGKPVIGADGRIVMIDAEGRPIHPTNNTDGTGAGAANGKGKDKANAGRKRFQKKTRQVHLVPDEVRQLQKEERYPWVLEDSHPEHKQLWIAQLEDTSKAETHAFLMPAANDAFKFVPSHRWYKFQKKLRHELPTDTANVEALYNKTQKKDPHLWLASLNGGRGASAATTAMFKQEETKPTIGSQSVGPGGRRLKTVDTGMNSLFDDDDDADSKRQRQKEMGEDGDMDEQLFEEDFADDDEAIPVDGEDEEAKEAEERLKREYRLANKHREAGIDEDVEEDVPQVTKSAKKLQKMIRNREGNDAYESDEEENPYASEEEEEEEEEIIPTGPAIQPQPQQADNSTPNTPKSAAAAGKPLPPSTTSNSRAASPVASPNHGGHSLLAKRATSPKLPKVKVPGVNSPPGSRANSPTPGSRATSPLANSPGGPERANNKRKAEDGPGPSNGSVSPVNGQNAGPPKPKKKKIVGPVSAAELEALLVDWLRKTPDATTRDCIQHFNAYLTDTEKKSEFSSMVKRVAILKNGVLALRPNLQGS